MYEQQWGVRLSRWNPINTNSVKPIRWLYLVRQDIDCLPTRMITL